MKKSLTKKELTTLLVIITGLNLLAWYGRHQWQLNTDGLMIASMVIGVSSLLIPTVGYYVVWCWDRIAGVLGWINSRIILSVLFFLFLFPLSLLYRLFNKDTLHLRKPDSHSLFADRNHQYTEKDFENMW